MIKRIKGNGGASVTIEFLAMIVIIFFVFTMIIDFGMFFADRNVLTNAAQNGARLAAVYGGDSETPIAKEYGSKPSSSNCSKVGASGPASCAVVIELENNTTTGGTIVKKVTCGPSKTTSIGERTWCEIRWQYKGIGFLNKVIGKDHVIRASGESEVMIR